MTPRLFSLVCAMLAAACGGRVSGSDVSSDDSDAGGASQCAVAPDGHCADAGGAPAHDASTPPVHDAGVPSDAPVGVDSSVDAAPPIDFHTACNVQENVMFVDGDPQDFIHPGPLFLRTGTWQVRTDAQGNGFGHVWLLLDTGMTLWSADFATASGPLVVGRYDNAERYGFGSPNRPGMDIGGNSRGCNMLSGWFEVVDIQSVADGGAMQLSEILVVFEQHCELVSAALRGCIHVKQ